MGDKKLKHSHLVEFLVSKGKYDEESAIKVVEDVIEAQKTTRLLVLEQYKNKRMLVELGGLNIEVFVHDVKVTVDGIQYQVQPVAGDKNIWVKSFIKLIK